MSTTLHHHPTDHEHHDHDDHEHHHEHDDHHDHADQFRRLFWWSLLLAVPVIAFSDMVQEWFGYTIDLPGARAVAPLFGIAVFVTGGRPFLMGGLAELLAGVRGSMPAAR